MKTLAIALLTLSSLVAIGQDTTKSNPLDRFVTQAQVSFIFPLGTNGVDSYKKDNILSLNIIAGVNGSVDGVELGGYVNITNGHVKGFQGAGFSNVVTRDLTGVQVAGFANVCNGNVDGAQFSGFVNLNMKTTKGFQLAGFLNVASDTLDGGQISGFMNFANKEASGLFATGFINVCEGKMKGTQVSGFINAAREVEGFQIGFFNFCDTISKGAPLGFFSFVAKGYHKLELEYATDLDAAINFKTGIEKFYNILSVGVAFEGDNLAYGFGYGLGRKSNLGKRSSLNIDLMIHQLSKGKNLLDHYDLLSKLKVNYSHNIADHLTVFAGPSLSVRIQEFTTNQDGLPVDPVKADFIIYDRKNDNNYLSIYPGLNLGLRF